VRGIEDFGNRRCVGDRQIARDRKRFHFAHHHQLGLCPATDQPHDTVAEPQAGDAGPEGLDFSGVFEPWNVGRPAPRCGVAALALVDVGPVEAGGSDPHTNLALAGGRGRYFIDGDDLGPAGGGVSDSSHGPTLTLLCLMRLLPLLLAALLACSGSTSTE